MTDPRPAFFYPPLTPRIGGLSAALVVALLAGCSSTAGLREYVPKIVTPYRIDIQQGNFVTLDMVEKLQAGQTKDQVRFILGTPMLTDVFHQERWDFIFRSAKGWNDPEKRRLTVFFDRSEKLEKWEAVDVPKAVDVAAPAFEEPPGFFRRILGGSSTAVAPQAGGGSAPAMSDAPASAPVAVGGTSNVNTAAPAAAPTAATPTTAPTPATAPMPATTPETSAPAGESAPGFFSRLFGRSKPDSGVPAAAAAASAALPDPQITPVEAVAPVPAAPVPVAAAPSPRQPASAANGASGAEDKPGILGRMFGWMRPGTGAATAAADAIPAAAAVPAPAAEPIVPARSAAMIAGAPTAVAQAVPATVVPPAAIPTAAPAPVAAPPTVAPTSPSAAATTPASIASVDAPPAVRAAIVAAIEQWRQAWSSKNAAAYIARYEPQYKTAGLTRAEWQVQRTDRIKRPASIGVTVSEVRMAQESDGAVAVSFVQKYESPTFKETGRKLLVFGDYNGQWLIREESFLADSK